MSDLAILYNCASNICIDAYHHVFSFTNILHPFLNAADMSMIIHAKLILAHLSAILTNDEVKEFLQLSSSSAESLIALLGEASTSSNRKANGFTVTELAKGMNKLLVCSENGRYLAKATLIPSIASVITCGSTQEKVAGCELLWNLLQESEFKIAVLENDLPFTEMLKQLEESKETSLHTLASSTLMDLVDSSEIGKREHAHGFLWHIRKAWSSLVYL